ncbi:MAG: DNA mismatch repair endonuclease MutL [Thermodesulfobacteriota bacterium]|nr:DNA mismatch repair endonuclease MutL [Thermodesulfobacteriota bacterium]
MNSKLMALKIEILPEKLCNQIAAGEVVERPSSVVKELIENSLDAGADHIVVEVDRGGKKRIVVADNGSGMGRDDIFLCFERHATSKIRSEEDLFHLHYHGFRGEALPSIAAVSRLTVTSRSGDDATGMRLVIFGGKINHTEEVGTPCGTTFEVRDLFFNIPARRKFLRRDETEFGHISEIVTRLALAHPAVHFKLHHNGRTILDLYRQSTSLDRIAMVLGRSVVADLLEINVATDPLSLTGYLARPTVNRSTTTGIYSFVNGRFVKDRVLHHAIMDGYRQLLMKGRYPVCVLFLELDSQQVDVNVHPTKHEVRFRDQRDVHHFVSQSVREVLRNSTGELQPHRESLLPSSATISASTSLVSLPVTESGQPVQYSQVNEIVSAYPPSQSNVVARGENLVLSVEERGYFASLTIIGQYHRSYILCEDGDDLILIDQHAAHERIGFERFKHQYNSGSIETQELLFPEIVELSVREDTELREQLEALKRLGFGLDPFGGTSWAIKAIPTFLLENDAKTMVCDVLMELSSVGVSTLSQDAFDAVLIKMACHGMIRANQRLGMVEMKALLQQLDEVDFNKHCPHGRPIMQRLTIGDVEKMFRRV